MPTIKGVLIRDGEYDIFVKPVIVYDKDGNIKEKYGDYWRLIKALLMRITTEQLNNITIIFKNKNIIFFHELVNCFKYEQELITNGDGIDGIDDTINGVGFCIDGHNNGTGNCICGVAIDYVFNISNVETNDTYHIGSTCIKNWSDYTYYEQQAEIQKQMLNDDIKKDCENTTRCSFCKRKTTRMKKTDKDENNNCIECKNKKPINICKKIFNAFKEYVKKRIQDKIQIEKINNVMNNIINKPKIKNNCCDCNITPNTLYNDRCYKCFIINKNKLSNI